MAITLRPHQQLGISQIKAHFGSRGNTRVLYVLPTGGGKTVLFSHITQSAANRRRRVLILVHRVELLRQASRSLAAMGLEHGLIQAGQPLDLSLPVQVASVQTIARRLGQIPPDWFDFIIIDEAHHATAGTWRQVLAHQTAARVLGVTATPCRADGRGLGEVFQSIVLGPSAAELTAAGYLAAARVFAPPIGFDARSIRRRMGDFDMGQAADQLGGRQIMGDAVGHYRQHLGGRTAIAFCCSVAHAEAVAAAFQAQGIAAASIDGTMSAHEREGLLGALGEGQLQVLTSCSLIGEGVDVPSVAGCLLLRPTQSVALHLQMIGRCLRPQPGKVAVILDHVGNYQRLGHHLEERDWSLEGRVTRSASAAPSVAVCGSCFAAYPSGAASCPECGHVAPPAVRELAVVQGELREVELAAAKARRAEQGQAVTLEELIRVGLSRGMRNPRGWARHVLAGRSVRAGRASARFN